MATSSAESLSVLDSMLQEVLVQLGKALKANISDGSRGVGRFSSTLRERSKESVETYHFALDNIEGEILRAKAVLLRDLAKLRAARAPPSPQTPPPMPLQRQPQEQQTTHEQAAPAAIMGAPILDLPSAAAHTMNPPPFVPGHESAPVAPFPDMGLDMSSDIVDLTSNDINPLQGIPKAPMQSSVEPPPAVKAGTGKSPSATATSKAPDAVSQALGVPPEPKQSTALEGDESSTTQMLDFSNNGTSGVRAVAAEAPEFTNMQFSLDTSTTGMQNAPPAPMPAFDLSGFTNNGAPSDFSTETSFESMPNDMNMSISTETAKDGQNEAKNIDNVFDLDGTADNMDLDLDLETDTVNDSTFDDLFLDTGDSSGMGQFDNAFFGLD
ncbi:hypothetical protein Micbo1qcDRAFT_199928 [Microdochium bolleyi]|uniref:Uncharacterized protein n=1 Tax=Microdochium bolleyi TaxID=196109 RepID=A0A136JJ86_9PEZI|nr:hypothetical protein Micbo1qcDRAFT_199928 [Microdochium bolleyi]